MAKHILRLASVLIIMFIAVPFLISMKQPHTYSLPLDNHNAVSLHMPDGKYELVSAEEYFSGAAAAYLPRENDVNILRAFCVMLNTPELTENGVCYLSPDERAEIFGDKCDEKDELYSAVWESVENQQLTLGNDAPLSLSEYAFALGQCEGSYTDMLSSLFPGGGLKTGIS